MFAFVWYKCVGLRQAYRKKYLLGRFLMHVQTLVRVMSESIRQCELTGQTQVRLGLGGQHLLQVQSKTLKHMPNVSVSSSWGTLDCFGAIAEHKCFHNASAPSRGTKSVRISVPPQHRNQ